MDDGPGSVPYRFRRLMEELDKRFPINPLLSDPPEPKYLAAIDRLIERDPLREKEADY